MPGREGGKKKPLKAAKKEKQELDADDIALREQRRREAAELKKAQEAAKQHGPMGKQGGISKSGKKK